jgi:hypothetical protein
MLVSYSGIFNDEIVDIACSVLDISGAYATDSNAMCVGYFANSSIVLYIEQGLCLGFRNPFLLHWLYSSYDLHTFFQESNIIAELAPFRCRYVYEGFH